jgi:hypothetical protein
MFDSATWTNRDKSRPRYRTTAFNLCFFFNLDKITSHIVMAEDLSGLEGHLGFFQFEKQENLEPWLKAVGQNIVMRKISLQSRPAASLLWETKDGKKRLTTT